MGWLPLFVDETDLAVLLDWLNAEPDIAFVLADGPRRWKAVATVNRLKDGRHALWHVAGAPLPLLRESGRAGVIADPWSGWEEQRTGFDPTTPYFGPGHTSIFWLNLHARHRPSSAKESRNTGVPLLGVKDLLSLTSVEWIGNHYRKAPPQSHRWWRHLKTWVSQSATKLTAGRHKFWAFPSALAKLRGGMEYYANGFDLSASLRSLDR